MSGQIGGSKNSLLVNQNVYEKDQSDELFAKSESLDNLRSILTVNSGEGYGADLIGYKRLDSEIRSVLDKLVSESKSVLDYIPTNLHELIRMGLCTVDCSGYINNAINKLRGDIFFPAGTYPISSPIKLQRGRVLRGDGSFDSISSSSTKILLLPYSNCSMVETPLAAGTGVATHFMGIDKFLFNGNKTYQDSENIAIKFHGAFVGSWIRHTCITNNLGTALSLAGGSDVELSHVWIQGNTVSTGYSLDTNYDITDPNALSGLLQLDNVYVENTSKTVLGNPRVVESDRGKAIRLRKLVSVNIVDLHMEGAAVGIDLDQCHIVNIGKITSAFIGDNDFSESSLIRFLNSTTRVLSTGPLYVSPRTANTYFIRKAAGVISNYIPDYNPPFAWSSGYSCVSDTLYGYRLREKTSFNNQLSIKREGGYSIASLSFHLGDPESSTTPVSRIEEKGGGLVFGSSINQPTNTYKNFISIKSPGNAGDSILLGEPLTLGIRASASNIAANSIYVMGTSVGFGLGPVWQRTTGSNATADAVSTVKRGVGVPIINAEYIGQMYVDTTARIGYLAVNFGTGATDWKPITA